MIRNKVFRDEAATKRAGTFYAALCNEGWAVRQNELPIVKALAEGTNSSGGFLVPSEITKAIFELKDVRGVFRKIVGGPTSMTSDSLSTPRRVGGLSAFFSAEASTLTESSGKLGQCQSDGEEARGADAHLVRIAGRCRRQFRRDGDP
jgi:HK97 family phage major capsid protein